MMEVAGSSSPFACQKMNLVAAKPPAIVSSADCPPGTEWLGAENGLGSCEKTIAGRSEIVLKVNERCPPGYTRFIDPDGDAACRPPKRTAGS